MTLLDARGRPVARMRRMHDGGLFTAVMPARLRHYRLRIHYLDDRSIDCEDAYRLPSALGAVDLYLLGEGTHQRIYETLGAHLATLKGIAGTRFAVWAPNASRVSVVGDFNDWDGRRHSMRLHPANGIWELFVPDIAAGSRYKYELLDNLGRVLPLKTDPYAQYLEPPPGNAAIVYCSRYRWQDAAWMKRRPLAPRLDEPASIYEVHAGSWRRNDARNHRPLTYRELADELTRYVVDMGYTHVELLPVTEHPFDGSWGYQPIGLYAATQRFGNPDDLRYLIDKCHRAGIGVIVDWVAAHFPKDEHGLRRFDGTALYEHEDPRRGEHADWGTLVFNYGRREVVNYLLGSALFWIDEFHVDGLRVDAVASMLYLDYSRKDGEWLPNVHGGNENLEAVDFLRLLNMQVHARGAATHAEESTAWRGVTRSTSKGGLGFTFKWNMGWMNDSLAYMREDPVNRRYHHDKMTFGLVYAFNENFVLPLSHDEVVHGKGSLLGKMPGDEWQRFANLRAYLASMFCHPGKKLLFMGGDIAQRREWNHDRALDWDLLEQPLHRGIQLLVRDLNRIYRTTRALFELDFEPRGFEWINWQDSEHSVLSWLRHDTAGNHVVCVTNFTPVVRYDYRIGVPGKGVYREMINTDARYYGGSDSGNIGYVVAETAPAHGQPASLALTLPPLASLILAPDSQIRSE
ncbi:MAG: 1,4-alpha-glucan branching protein GlgB [Woeseiaceae bacterium]|nr:1,4-alpha-glucan branching protein GlgB [Woeseiaceae bacterium]